MTDFVETSRLSFEDVVLAAKCVVAAKGEDFICPPHLAGWFFEPNGVTTDGSFGVNRTKPACLVGHVLHHLDLQHRPNHGLSTETMESKSLLFVTKLWQLNDVGLAWGTCLKLASEWTERQVSHS